MSVEFPRSSERVKMVHEQIIRRGIIDEDICGVFRRVPRHLFVPEAYRSEAYADHPLPIGEGQTISQPYIVALMTHHLNLSGKERVLEIGTGSGYQTAVLAQLAAEVFTVELIPTLSHNAQHIINQLNIENVYFHVGDGSLGWKKHAPYDRIIITAAVPAMSDAIKGQIQDGGMIIAPVGDRWRQVLTTWVKKQDAFIKEKILPVVFVPLRGTHGWQD